MRRIVIAPDSFKGSIDAPRAARAIAEGWRERDGDAELVLLPLADGGEGTAAAIAAGSPDAVWEPVRVPGARAGDADRETAWLRLPGADGRDRGVVELASCCGIELFGDELDPWRASTEAFGIAIAAALDRGLAGLVLAIGSSASTDGGAGMLGALGARFEGDTAPGVSGADGGRADRASSTPRGLAALRGLRAADLGAMRALPPEGVRVLCDVTNPLTGPRGAARVFGPQKGLTGAECEEADGILAAYASLIDVDPATPGAGAAGGTGFGLLAWGARLVPGAAEIAGLIGFDRALAGAALVITGEGSFDAQSAAGKAPGHVLDRARAAGAPVAVVAGRIEAADGEGAPTAAVSLTELAGSAEAALRAPAHWLRVAGASLAERFA